MLLHNIIIKNLFYLSTNNKQIENTINDDCAQSHKMQENLLMLKYFEGTFILVSFSIIVIKYSYINKGGRIYFSSLFRILYSSSYIIVEYSQ